MRMLCARLPDQRGAKWQGIAELFIGKVGVLRRCGKGVGAPPLRRLELSAQGAAPPITVDSGHPWLHN